jgi:hypothetical protein
MGRSLVEARVIAAFSFDSPRAVSDSSENRAPFVPQLYALNGPRSLKRARSRDKVTKTSTIKKVSSSAPKLLPFEVMGSV